MFKPVFKYTDRDWTILSRNPSAVHILEEKLQKVDWDYLFQNPAAVHIWEKKIQQNPHDKTIHWKSICENPNATHILLEKIMLDPNSHDICWTRLSKNPGAVHILEKFPHKIDWEQLSTNPEAISLLQNNIGKICWKNLFFNKNATTELLLTGIKRVFDETPENTSEKLLYKQILSSNPGNHCLQILLKRPDLIEWNAMACYNPNPFAMQLVQKKIMNVLKSKPLDFTLGTTKEIFIYQQSDKLFIDLHELACNPVALDLFKALISHPKLLARWKKENFMVKNYMKDFSHNPNAIRLLEDHKTTDDYCWKALSENPNAIHLLFPLDTLLMKIKIAKFKKELKSYVFCPQRQSRILKIYSSVSPTTTKTKTKTNTKKRKQAESLK